VTTAAPFDDARRAIHDRIEAGYAADLGFTFRRPERSTDPATLLPGARSLLVAAMRYRREDDDRPTGPQGRIARYAWVDHYAPLRSALSSVGADLRKLGYRARVLADDNALVDRAAAYRAGLGWFGKNANLLLPQRGSWFVLGSLVTDADLAPAEEPVADGCGSCVRCLDGCPTGAIVAPGVVDARRCLAWLVQRPGPFPHEYREALGDRIYGCDDCQEVCPPNRTADRREAPLERPADAQPWTELVSLITDSDARLLERHGRFYLPGRDVNVLRRNALLALANLLVEGTCTYDVAINRALTFALDHPDPVVRSTAVWACARIATPETLALAELATADDGDPLVHAERVGAGIVGR
jgi:epoxyqueuosine reductase